MNISFISVRGLQKFVTAVALVAMVFSPFTNVPLTHAVAFDTFFSDSFETTPAFPNWTSADNKWQNDANGPHSGDRLANVNGPSSVGGEILKKDVSTVGHIEIELSFWYRYDGLDAGDVVFVEWTPDGTTWNTATSFVGADLAADDVLTWTRWVGTLLGAEEQPNFSLRFRSTSNAGNDQFYLDDVALGGIPVPTTATLTLLKTTVGGSAVDADFTLTATGPSSIAGAEASTTVTAAQVLPGTYTLGETGGPTGYTAGAYSCVKNSAAAVEGNSIALVAGDVAVCTVTNTFTEVVAPKQCTIVSDPITLANDVSASSTFVHPAWTTALATTGAQWIWSSDAAQNATFTRTFAVDVAPTGSVLRMAVDNSYTAKLNGTPLTCDGSGITNFANPIDTCTAPVVAGVNTLEVVAQNAGGPNSADLINPAGLIFELAMSGASCALVETPMYSIDGYKWSDENADGVWDDEEGGVAGWTIILTNTDTEVATTTVTGKGGYYSFLVPEGSYEVTEGSEIGWDQTAVSGDGADGDRCYITIDSELEIFGGSCDFGNHQNEVAQCLVADENLLSNGSFETPIVTDNAGQWHLFASVPSWTSSTGIFELWRNLMGPASQGEQNAELDDYAPAALSQSVSTVAGNGYMVKFDFAARPGTDNANNILEVLADGASLGSVSLDGTGDTEKGWVTYSYEFIADDSATNIEFKDLGVADGLGTLLDNTSVCLTKDNALPTTGSLTIDKVVVGESASSTQAFTFDTWMEAHVSMTASSAPMVFSELEPGAYSFSEIMLPSRWAVESIVCTDGEGPELDLNTALEGATVNIAAGENVTCVVTNRYTPKDSNSNEENIIVRKVVTEGSDTSTLFGFEASWLDEEGAFDFVLSAGQMWDSGNLLAGDSYDVYERALPSGWNKPTSSCVSEYLEGGEVTYTEAGFELRDGDTVTCTFINDQDRYILEGYLWEDTNENGLIDPDESRLQNWGVKVTNGTTTFATTTNASGYYKFNVPEGTWTITEDLQSGWDLINPIPEKYVVTVPAPFIEEPELFTTILGWFVTPAYAAVVDTLSNFNFGNKPEPTGSSSGSRRNSSNGGGGNGSSGPVPQVLGAATSTMPVGAPNTGAGGTTAVVGGYALLAVLPTVRRVQHVR